jgi:hypothetical protein
LPPLVICPRARRICLSDSSSDGGDAELAFMPRTMTVTLLNDLKHIDQGGAYRMDKDATIVRIGPGELAGTVKVRYATPQLSSGGCPFLTEFNLSAADYAEARKAFEGAKDAAEQKGAH